MNERYRLTSEDLVRRNVALSPKPPQPHAQPMPYQGPSPEIQQAVRHADRIRKEVSDRLNG